MSAYVKSAPPHITSPQSTPAIYWKQFAVLFLLTIGSSFVFGWQTWRLVSLSVGSAVLAEIIACRIFIHKSHNLYDGSSAWMGLLFALMLPPSIPSWLAAVSIFSAVLFSKELFGGLGQNFFHPALLGRLFVFLMWSGDERLYQYESDGGWFGVIAEKIENMLSGFLPANLFSVGDSLGAISALYILILGFLLIQQKVIRFQIPILYLLITFVVGFFLKFEPILPALFFTAFFILPDLTTTPSTQKGMAIYISLVSILTLTIQSYVLSYFEAVCLSVLILNSVTPWIEQWVRAKNSYPIKKVAYEK